MSVTVNKFDRASNMYDATFSGADLTHVQALDTSGGDKAGKNSGESAEQIGTGRYLVNLAVLVALNVSGYARPQFTGTPAAYSFKGV